MQTGVSYLDTGHPAEDLRQLVHVDIQTGEETELVMYTLNGIKVKSLILSDAHNTVSVEGIPTGLYVVKVTSAHYQKVERLILK